MRDKNLVAAAEYIADYMKGEIRETCKYFEVSDSWTDEVFSDLFGDDLKLLNMVLDVFVDDMDDSIKEAVNRIAKA